MSRKVKGCVHMDNNTINYKKKEISIDEVTWVLEIQRRYLQLEFLPNLVPSGACEERGCYAQWYDNCVLIVMRDIYSICMHAWVSWREHCLV